MLQQSITVGARNPWDSFEAHGAWPNRAGGHVVGLVRVQLDNPTITELPIEVDPNRTQLLAAIFCYQLLLLFNRRHHRPNGQIQWILDVL